MDRIGTIDPRVDDIHRFVTQFLHGIPLHDIVLIESMAGAAHLGHFISDKGRLVHDGNIQHGLQQVKQRVQCNK